MKTLLTHSELREERIRSNEEKKDPESAALILLPNNLLRGEEGSGVARFLEENVDCYYNLHRICECSLLHLLCVGAE